MATDFTEEGAADAVIESFAGTPDERLRTILNSLVRHLHAAVREVEPSIAEWERAIEFLTATGQKCTDIRQEFILLSDVLGISMLVETINERGAAGATQSTVLGPFHMTRSPVRALGDTIDLVGESEPCVVTGRVVGADGTPLPGAVRDAWQANDHGAYDVQEPGKQPAGNGRGLFTADGQGRFWFRTIVPSYYPIPTDGPVGEDPANTPAGNGRGLSPADGQGRFWFRTIVPSYSPIPTDGPVGELLAATGRHAFRPAHIHFIVTAPGYRP